MVTGKHSAGTSPCGELPDGADGLRAAVRAATYALHAPFCAHLYAGFPCRHRLPSGSQEDVLAALAVHAAEPHLRAVIPDVATVAAALHDGDGPDVPFWDLPAADRAVLVGRVGAALAAAGAVTVADIAAATVRDVARAYRGAAPRLVGDVDATAAWLSDIAAWWGSGEPHSHGPQAGQEGRR